MKLATTMAICVPLLLTGCSSTVEYREGFATSSAEKFPEGTWTLIEYSVAGVSAPTRNGSKLTLQTAGQSTLERNGQVTPLDITFAASSIPRQFDISFATSEDSVQMGGGGPRPGLLRVEENGNVQILVATSSESERPTGFSEAQKAKHIYYHATPATSK